MRRDQGHRRKARIQSLPDAGRFANDAIERWNPRLASLHHHRSRPGAFGV